MASKGDLKIVKRRPNMTTPLLLAALEFIGTSRQRKRERREVMRAGSR